ncbi:MAG: haloacid dehalogenase-like hydrolase [Verrucomicrobia bacterium]|jgi:phosphoglycolate phosphatase-like HAD superfamily hydrolase|nr:haloacid dehalogenase-like hydrolase [Verrucomicrobiota bacterium]
MIRLVLFDIDGTLIRTGGAGVHAFGRTAELLYGVPGVAERTHFHGRTDTALVREFFLSNGLQGRSWDIRHFLDAYVFLLDHRLQQNRGEICPGVPQFLQALKELPEPPAMGLLTGNIRLGAKIKLGAHSLWGDWMCGAFADDHDDRNQLARIARDRASRQLGRRLEGPEIVVIGDTHRDVECAQAIGAQSLGVCTGGGSPDELRKAGATWVVTDLGEFPMNSLQEQRN